jgi:superfamily II DNA or RNA helicase
MIEDRQYQSDDVNHAMNHGREMTPIHCAPTGSGKTVIQARIAAREMARGDSTAILTPRNEIFTQTQGLAEEICGADNVAVLRARREGESWRQNRPIHIVSWPTLISRVKRSHFWFPSVRRVLVDECHLSMAPKILAILEHYAPKATVDGYTATPARMTGKGLGRYFTTIKHVVSVRQLMSEGYLAPVEYWGGNNPDLTGVKVRRGDYEVKKLSDACVVLVGDAVDNWLRLASDRHTIVFAVDIAHAEMLAHRFKAVGVSAAALHTRLDMEERDEVNRLFKSQAVQVLVNVGIASYGYDAPSVNCIQICRPTKSIVLHLQMIGRGMRPKPDGSECMVLDHAGNVDALGMADDLFRWRLDEGKKACENWSRKEESGEPDPTVHTCEECGYLFSQRRVCPKCGWKVPYSKRDVAATEDDLVPIGKNMVKRLPEGWPSHEVFFQMLTHKQREKKYSSGWARNQFKKKVGCWPPGHWVNLAAIPPNKRVQNWITSRNIAYAKWKQKQQAGATR